MKTILTACFLIAAQTVHAQTLPPAAQDLYDQAVAQDSQIVQYALNAGAQIFATPDDSSFYIQWFPVGSTPSATPLVVTLHGTDGFAFHEFFKWHQQCIQHGCGIIAMQWWRGDSAIAPNDYFGETRLYEHIDTALTRISYPSNKALLHGFSRGSARSYAIIFEDTHGGQNYFCTTISNAGKADSSYGLYNDINNNVYGPNVFAGENWALYCGANDPSPAQSGCVGMGNTYNWLIAQGATVDVFFQDPVGDHEGFSDTTIYMDSILSYYLLCYNGTLSVSEHDAVNTPDFFPNPFQYTISIRAGLSPQKIYVMNTMGQVLMYLDADATTFDLSGLSSGVYLVCLEDQAGNIRWEKIVKD
jgi:hypothetical protein